MSRRLALVVVCLALSTGIALAAPAQQISGDGTLHKVEATYVGKPAMSVLRHTLVRSDGSSQIALVPGTEDVFSDVQPALAIDPVRGIPMLAWSRNTGGGFDVFVTAFDGVAWSAPVRALHDPTRDETRPQIQVGETLVHVVAPDGAGYVRVSLQRESLQPAMGPETLPIDGTPLLPGVDQALVEPSSNLLFFASDVLQPTPGDPGMIVVWGVRDEPVPIDYLQVLLLPEPMDDALATNATPIEGSLTVTAASSTRVLYTLFRESSWVAFSAVDLDETTTISDARAMLADMIRRGSN